MRKHENQFDRLMKCAYDEIAYLLSSAFRQVSSSTFLAASHYHKFAIFSFKKIEFSSQHHNTHICSNDMGKNVSSFIYLLVGTFATCLQEDGKSFRKQTLNKFKGKLMFEHQTNSNSSTDQHTTAAWDFPRVDSTLSFSRVRSSFSWS